MFGFGKEKRLSEICSSVVQHSEDAIVAIDWHHNIVLYNEGAQRIFGYMPEEVMGRHLNVLLPERFHLQHDLMVDEFGAGPAAVRHTSQRSRQIYGRRKDGSDFLTSTMEASAVLERSLERAAALVTSFKRVAESDTQEKLSTFDLIDLSAELASSFNTRSESIPIDFQNLIPQGIIITGYPELLRQVLSNLMNNALVHAFDNRASGQIIVQAHTIQDQVEITLSDNGIGIADDIQSRIFDPMFTTRMGRGGVGLGLSVVHNIVTRNLGGKIHVRHARPCGACFVLTLPLIAPLHPTDSDE